MEATRKIAGIILERILEISECPLKNQVPWTRTRKIRRKEMKNADMERVSKELPKRLATIATAPYEAYVALKTNYSVAKRIH